MAAHGTHSAYVTGCRCDRCKACLAEYHRTRTRTRRATGFCVRCGAASPRSRCRPCLLKAAAWLHARYQRRRARGLCTRCGRVAAHYETPSGIEKIAALCRACWNARVPSLVTKRKLR